MSTETRAAVRPAASLEIPAASLETKDNPIVSRLPADDPEFCDIISEFIEQFEKKLAELTAANGDGDLLRVAEIAHWIKGAGGTAGFDDLTAAATELEKSVKEGRQDQLPPLIERLKILASRLQVPAGP